MAAIDLAEHSWSFSFLSQEGWLCQETVSPLPNVRKQWYHVTEQTGTMRPRTLGDDESRLGGRASWVWETEPT